MPHAATTVNETRFRITLISVRKSMWRIISRKMLKPSNGADPKPVPTVKYPELV